MIKHIVMWKFKDGEKENMKKFLEGLNSLKNIIPEIKYNMRQLQLMVQMHGLNSAISCFQVLSLLSY